MREVKVIAWCDICAMENDGRTEATHTYTVGLVAGEVKPGLKVLELCDRHDKLATELAGILAAVGQRPELPSPARPATTPPARASYPRKWECPVCHRDVPRNTAVSHVWNNHRTGRRPPYPTKCPECGQTAGSAQGMGAHRRRIHGYDALADALAGVNR